MKALLFNEPNYIIELTHSFPDRQSLYNPLFSCSEIDQKPEYITTLMKLTSLFEVDTVLIRSIIWLFSGTPSSLQFVLKTKRIADHASASLVCKGLTRACESLDFDKQSETTVSSEAPFVYIKWSVVKLHVAKVGYDVEYV